MKFAPVERHRAYEGVVAQFEAAILSGDLAPGDRLPSERELTADFGVSRPTIREALRVSESLGLIEVRPGDPRGPIVVAQPTLGFLRIVDYMLRDSNGLVHLIELRMILEGSAVYIAAGQPAEALDPMREALQQMSSATTPEELSAADSRFHEAAGKASGNPILTAIVGSLREPIVSSINRGLPTLGWPEARDIACERHREVLDLVMAGDGIGASRVSRLNLYNTYRHVVDDEHGRLTRALGMDGSSEFISTTE